MSEVRMCAAVGVDIDVGVVSAVGVFTVHMCVVVGLSWHMGLATVGVSIVGVSTHRRDVT